MINKMWKTFTKRVLENLRKSKEQGKQNKQPFTSWLYTVLKNDLKRRN